jgi:hypothetical protein
MNIELTPEFVRVIGCLMEKAVTTPDQYPLTLNALVNACNQKSSREPVMQLEQGAVGRIVRDLEERHFVASSEGSKSNVYKYTQRFCNTLLGDIKLNPAEYAIICVLMLRGAQTPGELRTRCNRLHEFPDNQSVKDTLQDLLDREKGPLIARLSRVAGRQDHEYQHLFSNTVTSVDEETVAATTATLSVSKPGRIAQLESRVEKLEAVIVDLAGRLGEDIDLGHQQED